MSDLATHVLRWAVPALALTLAGSPARSGDAFEGVYARSKELCSQAQQDIQTVFETGEAVLSARGILGIEYHCDFMDLRTKERTPGWLATALCEEPGYAFPDLLAIMPRGEGELEVTSMRPAEEDGNSGMYFLCEGVALP
jgi:hypothetical protein